MTSLRHVVVFGALAAALAAAAPAAVSLRPSPGTPDPKKMVLLASDIGEASVRKQGYYKDADFPSVISYSREFEEGAVGSADLVAVESQAEIGKSTALTTQFVKTIRQLFGSKSFRGVLRETFEEEFSGELEGAITNLVIGRPRSLGAGDDGFDVLITVRVLGTRIDSHITFLRVERVLGSLTTVGAPGDRVSLSLVRRLAGVMAGRMRVELAPAATRVPTISGSAQEGQTLTASKGAWIHAPVRFTYQWQRCDASGRACAPIPGATAVTYTVTATDVGSTIRVAVTARNAVGSTTAVSAQTAVVAAATPPVNTSPPTISGTAQQGQTLTGSTGSWTGNPATFAYQWQRCDAAAVTCADVVNATAQTYVVNAGDAGFRLRLAVTATNAVGSGTAHSAPTGIVL